MKQGYNVPRWQNWVASAAAWISVGLIGISVIVSTSYVAGYAITLAIQHAGGICP